MIIPKGKKSAGKKGNNPLGSQDILYPLSKQEDLTSDDDHAHIDHIPLEEGLVENEAKTKKPKLDSSSDGRTKRSTGQERKGKGKMSRPGERSKTTPTAEGVAPAGWSGQDITLFRMLQPIYGHNYCVIAEVMTKTCYEVKLIIIVIKGTFIMYTIQNVHICKN